MKHAEHGIGVRDSWGASLPITTSSIGHHYCQNCADGRMSFEEDSYHLDHDDHGQDFSRL